MQTAWSTRRAPTVIMMILLCCSPSIARASYCAYEVTVSKPDGAPAANVPVAIVREGRQLRETRTDGRGVARLCDAPLTSVDVVVGVDLCGSVLVRQILPMWPDMRRVFVTYERETCREGQFSDHCLALVRVTAEDGSPVSGALLGSDGAGASASVQTDAFGRLFIRVGRGETFTGNITKEGRKATRISERCARFGEDLIEDVVIMQK